MTDQTTDVATGPYGTARRIPPANYRDSAPAGVDGWIITAPHAPLWSQYMLDVISLADFRGIPQATKRFPDATHELHVVALDPDRGPYDATTVGPPGSLPFLTPVNIAEQIITTDDQARRLAQLCAKAVVDGVLTPETADAPDRIRTQWRTSIRQTLDHARDPHHGHAN
ncbi:hypothetical protein ABZ772_19770 [Streptomyces griseoincarnatus]